MSVVKQLKFSDYFRPVYRIGGEEWQRIEQAIVFVCHNL